MAPVRCGPEPLPSARHSTQRRPGRPRDSSCATARRREPSIRPGSHSAAYHLYINGQYWGLYDTDERPDARFAATYLGGSPDDYDAIRQQIVDYYRDKMDPGAIADLTRAGLVLAQLAGRFTVLGEVADGEP